MVSGDSHEVLTVLLWAVSDSCVRPGLVGVGADFGPVGFILNKWSMNCNYSADP